MNLRDIKKDIEFVIGEFIDDCALFLAKHPEGDLTDLIEEAVDLYNDLKDKAAVKVEGNLKAYYNGLRKELLEKTDALYEKLSAAVSAKKE